MGTVVLKLFARRKYSGIKFASLELDSEDDSTNVYVTTERGLRIRVLTVTKDLVVKHTSSKVLANGFLQGNGYWNFITSVTRVPFSATGFKDLYDAEAALAEFLLDGSMVFRTEDSVVAKLAAIHEQINLSNLE